MTTICIGRAPVLTLWASIVAERLGWGHDTALTLGRAVSIADADQKGALAGTSAHPRNPQKESPRSSPAESTDAIRDVLLLGQIVRVAPTPEGPRAFGNDALLKPEAVERYLRAEFGSQLCAALSAMERLAATTATDTLSNDALRLYEDFRPQAPSGDQRRAAKCIFDLDRVHALVRARRRHERRDPD